MGKHKHYKHVNGEKRCIMSNKLINGNGKEAVLCKHAIDYVKKLGAEVTFTRKVKVTSMLLLMVFMISFTSAQFAFDNQHLPTLNPINATVTSIITGNGSFNETLTNLLYRRLDSTNDDLTSADWNYQRFDVRNVSVISGSNNLALDIIAGIHTDFVTGDVRLSGGSASTTSKEIEFLTSLSIDKIYASFVLGNGGLVFETSGGSDFIIRTPTSTTAGILFNVSGADNGRIDYFSGDDLFTFNSQALFEKNLTVENTTIHKGSIEGARWSLPASLGECTVSAGVDCFLKFGEIQFNHSRGIPMARSGSYTSHSIRYDVTGTTGFNPTARFRAYKWNGTTSTLMVSQNLQSNSGSNNVQFAQTTRNFNANLMFNAGEQIVFVLERATGTTISLNNTIITFDVYYDT